MIFILTTHTQVIVNTWKRAVALNLHFSRVLPHGRIIVMPSLSSCSTHWPPTSLTYEIKREIYFLCFVMLNSPDFVPSRKKGGIKTPKRSVSQKITAAIIQWFWKVAFTSITGGLSTVIILILIFSIHGDVHFYLILLKDFFFLLSADWSCSM